MIEKLLVFLHFENRKKYVMQKIMFSEKYRLESVVLSKVKPMTRRVITDVNAIQILQELEEDGWQNTADIQIFIEKYSRYKVGEVVAVAQSYKDLGYTKEWVEQHISPNPNANWNDPFGKKYPGWNNKMFVNPELMPHQIKIIDIKVERLQDISDEECLKEGITIDTHRAVLSDDIYMFEVNGKHYCQWHFYTPREAFAALINRRGVGGPGMWEENPFVFVYTFELVK